MLILGPVSDYDLSQDEQREIIEPNVVGGEKFLVTSTISAGGITGWRAAFTGGFTCQLEPGMILQVSCPSVTYAPGFNCKPTDYSEFEEKWIPETDRLNPQYTGYDLVLDKSLIGEELVEYS